VKSDLNFALTRIADRLDKIEGVRGGSSIESDLDMNDNTINNVDIAATAITAETLNVSGVSTFNSIVHYIGEGAGLIYGCIDGEDIATETTITTQGVPVQVFSFDSNGPANGLTPDFTNSHITITYPGIYFVAVSASVNSVTGQASVFEFSVQVNNGTRSIVPHVDRNIAGGGGSAGVISLSGIATLAADDTVEAWIENETNTENYLVEDISLTVIKIGGV